MTVKQRKQGNKVWRNKEQNTGKEDHHSKFPRLCAKAAATRAHILGASHVSADRRVTTVGRHQADAACSSSLLRIFAETAERAAVF